MHIMRLFAIALTATTLLAGPSGAVVFSDSGSDAVSITPTVDAFRDALGTLNANAPQNFAGGRREINWDGVPDAFSDPNEFPGDFFNGNVPGRARGIEFSTPGTGLQVSSTAASGEPVEFGFADNFTVFSPERLFTPLDDTFVGVNFFSPSDQTTPARTRGFGAVFTDVETEGSTFLAFFGAGGNLLAQEFVPVAPDGGLSFLGVTFDDPVIQAVLIQSGTADFNGTSFGPGDDVVMDDFIYGEPAPIPVPPALPLLAAGLAALGLVRLRSQGIDA
jgi:hypothetical protein